MAPLSKALNAQFAYKTDGPDAKTVYRGEVDPEWSVISLPHGGYVLGLILEAAILHQTGSSHPDPIHLTAHYIRSASFGAFEVHIREIKTGKGFKNISAIFVQNGVERILTHMIFGVLSFPEDAHPSAGPRVLTLEPPAREATHTPMHTHPSHCIPDIPFNNPGYKKHVRIANDPVYYEKTKEMEAGLEHGQYWTLIDKNERLKPSMVPYLADCAMSFPPVMFLNKNKSKELGIKDFWLPTMVLTVEFKFPIPKPGTPGVSQRTVALYSRGKFINDPSARHDSYVEVWTAPADLEECVDPGNDEWKVRQRCLAVSTQMALVVPAEVNRKNSERLGGGVKAKM